MTNTALLLQQIFNGLVLGSLYALTALGYTMVYGVLQLINFSHGDIVMMGAMTAAWLAPKLLQQSVNPSLTLTIIVLSAVIVCMLLSLIIERVAYRPLRQAPRLAPLITALGVSILLQTLAMLLWSPNPVSFSPMLPENPLEFFGAVLLQKHIWILLLAICTMGGLLFLVSYTYLGRAMRATAEKPNVAELMGIDTNRIIATTFGIGAALAAVAGVLTAEMNNVTQFSMGLTPGLKAFTAAVLGGIGSITGAMWGGILLGVLESVGVVVLAYLSDGVIGSQYQDILVFVTLMGVLWYRALFKGDNANDRA